MKRNAALCAVYLAFAMPIAMLGVAWPEIQVALGRAEGELGLLAGCYGIGRLSMGASSGALLRRAPFGPATAGAALVVGLSSAAVAARPAWWLLVVAVTVVGVGSGALESLGSRFLALHGSVRAAGVVAGSYGVGATIGPALVAWSGQWRMAYVVAAVVTVATGALFLTPGLRGIGVGGAADAGPGASARSAGGSRGAGVRARWSRGAGDAARGHGAAAPPTGLAVVLSLALFVTFIGIEVTAGQWAATLLEQARGLDRQVSGFAVSGFFGGVTVGRLLLGAVDLPQRRLPLMGFVLVPAMVAVAIGPPRAAPVALVVAGLALSPMFPALMATTGDRVGQAHAGRVSGWQLLAGNTGATAMPALTGVLVATQGPAAPSAVLVVLAVTGAVLLPVVQALSGRVAAVRSSA